MGFRFRKSFKLAPGVRWNLSGSGSSFTFGPRGASIGIGKRGAYLNSSIPGTGLSARTRLTGSASSYAGSRGRARASATVVPANCVIDDDGTISFEDEHGQPLAPHVVELAKKQNRELILSQIQRKCEEINDQLDALGRLHHNTPAPKPPRFIQVGFGEPEPAAPTLRKLGWFARFMPGRKLEVRDANVASVVAHQRALISWQQRKDQHEQATARRKLLVEKLILSDTGAMEEFLELSLLDIVWPRETNVAVEIIDNGELVALDVDLPELEDMPNKEAKVPARGLKLSVKELSATKVQKLYAAHVHGVVFRLTGETFAALPVAREVIVSGFTQRRDDATAQLRDDYVISVRVSRDAWSQIDFDSLESLDVTAALGRFDLKREMLASGRLKAVQPHLVT